MNPQLKYAGYFLFFILFSSCESKIENKGIATEIANASGLKEFSKIRSIEFTFNVDKDSTHTERHWKWMPRENIITFYGNADSITFKRMDTSTAALKKLNAQFTNDEYWLLFPLHLQWDRGYTLTDKDTATAPVTKNQYHRYIIQYNAIDGFTPGDMYVLYTDSNHIIREWAFHKTGVKEPSLMTTWENYGDFKGVKIARDHKTMDGKFRLYFTGITVMQ